MRWCAQAADRCRSAAIWTRASTRTSSPRKSCTTAVPATSSQQASSPPTRCVPPLCCGPDPAHSRARRSARRWRRRCGPPGPPTPHWCSRRPAMARRPSRPLASRRAPPGSAPGALPAARSSPARRRPLAIKQPAHSSTSQSLAAAWRGHASVQAAVNDTVPKKPLPVIYRRPRPRASPRRRPTLAATVLPSSAAFLVCVRCSSAYASTFCWLAHVLCVCAFLMFLSGGTLNALKAVSLSVVPQ